MEIIYIVMYTKTLWMTNLTLLREMDVEFGYLYHNNMRPLYCLGDNYLEQHAKIIPFGVSVITDNFHHLHFYTPNDKNWTADVTFYHLLQI